MSSFILAIHCYSREKQSRFVEHQRINPVVSLWSLTSAPEALKSPEAGKVSHALSAGSIVSAGELLARSGAHRG